MHSFTSSSDARLPRGGWRSAWIGALLLAFVPLGIWEVYWRAQGFRPQVDAVDESWILAMSRVPDASTVVLGTSRIQAALDPEAYAAEAGGRPPVSLALPGNSPLPLLEYIAESTTFRGVVFVEVLPLFAFDGSRWPEQRARELIARYEIHRVSWSRLTEDWLQVHALSHLVFRGPALLPARFTMTVAAGRWPRPNRTRMRPDRFGPVSAGRGDLESPQNADGERFSNARRAGRPATDAELAAFEARIERAVERIQGRGGQVVLAHLAAWGERQQIEEERFPRARYWDPLVSRTRAVSFATADHPEFATFKSSDSSHVNDTDAAGYAAALGRIVREKIR